MQKKIVRKINTNQKYNSKHIAMIFLMVLFYGFFLTSGVGFPDFETIDFPNKSIFSKNRF